VPKSIVTPCPESEEPAGRTSRFIRPRIGLLRTAAAATLVAAMTATGAGVARADVRGPDVASYDHENGSSLNWGAIRWVGGASFAFIKATEGGGYSNPHYRSDVAAARKHGLIRGAYHYARPSGQSNKEITYSASVEADQFANAIGSLKGPGNLSPVLDLEDAGTLNPYQLSLWVHTWLKRMTRWTGRTPIIYTGVSFWQESMGNSRAYAAYPLWLASYGVPRPQQIGGWKSYTFWQFTETGQMTGAGSPTDLSIFNGSLAQLKAMTVSKASARKAAAAAAAAARSAAARKAFAARGSAGASSMTSRFLNRSALNPDRSRADLTSSRSSLRSWLGVNGLDGSRDFSGS
jgi:GH25 family lysozyme M1 (1,4-beta-N-acetylmuramidase)